MSAKLPTARDIMTRTVKTIPAAAAVDEALRALVTGHHSGAPVVDASGAPVGVLSEHDGIRLLSGALAEGLPTGCVADHMTTEVETVPPSEDVLALSTRFTKGRHRRLLVVEDGRLVGLVSRRDLLAALERLDQERGQTPTKTTYETLAERHRELD
ncbi:MAG: CBS domain-containing protein [Myxococcota bacterium]|nr:CBS domain-containing protein [Myxococcota bacterium]